MNKFIKVGNTLISLSHVISAKYSPKINDAMGTGYQGDCLTLTLVNGKTLALWRSDNDDMEAVLNIVKSFEAKEFKNVIVKE